MKAMCTSGEDGDNYWGKRVVEIYVTFHFSDTNKIEVWEAKFVPNIGILAWSHT